MHRKKSKKTGRPAEVPYGTYCTEYKCGCIMHPLAGYLRKCGAHGARSLSGRLVKLDADVMKHNAGEVHRRYPVAMIIP